MRLHVWHGLPRSFTAAREAMPLELTAAGAVTQERCRTLVEGRNRDGAEKLMSLLRLKHRKVSRLPLGPASYTLGTLTLLRYFLAFCACVHACVSIRSTLLTAGGALRGWLHGRIRRVLLTRVLLTKRSHYLTLALLRGALPSHRKRTQS